MMVKFIPHNIEKSAPLSEKRFFNVLKNCKKTDGWIVFHSLNLSQRGYKKPYGEIDFVIIIPHQGVVCIEIKGGGVKCTNGKWSTVDRFNKEHPLKKSPFIQVRDGEIALRESIISNININPRNCYFGSIVVFPDISSPPISPEFKRDQVIDFQDIGINLDEIIESKIRSQRKRLGYISSPSLTKKADIKKITNYLKPNFEMKVLMSARLKKDKEGLKHLTLKQSQVLNAIEENPRILVKGSAGTGKTVIAFEILKSRKNDESVAFLCYNNVFGGWLKRKANVSNFDMLIAGPIYNEIIHVIKRSSYYNRFQEEFRRVKDRGDDESFQEFDSVLSRYALKAIQETGEKIDYLILDEAQDILTRPQLLDILDSWLHGGLDKGKWTILGDFNNQAIYSEDHTGQYLLDTLEVYSTHFVSFKLNENCRNTRNIARSISIYSGFDSHPFLLNQIEGEPVNSVYCKNKEHFTQEISKEIESLISQGVSASDITLLSPYKYQKSSALDITDHKIIDISNSSSITPKQGEIVFSTIHSFKGLESDVVLLIDVDGFYGKSRQSLLYTGISRACICLRLFINKNSQNEAQELLMKLFNEKGSFNGI